MTFEFSAFSNSAAFIEKQASNAVFILLWKFSSNTKSIHPNINPLKLFFVLFSAHENHHGNFLVAFFRLHNFQRFPPRCETIKMRERKTFHNIYCALNGYNCVCNLHIAHYIFNLLLGISFLLRFQRWIYYHFVYCFVYSIHLRWSHPIA